MEHSFDVDIAKEYGINCAVILRHLYFWIQKNKANEKHFYDGMYWTYNSIQAFESLFPYFTNKQIRSTMEKLEEEGLIVSGNYNASTYDRTKWYALTEKAELLLSKGQLDLPQRANGFSPEGKPIPDNNTYIDNNILVSKETNCKTVDPVQRVVDAWNSLESFGVPPVKRMTKKSVRGKMLNARIAEYGIDKVLMAVESIKDSDFLLGRTKSAWLVSFDWFVKPNNFPKVYEGNYLNPEKRKMAVNDDYHVEDSGYDLTGYE